jgi:hypothetical protein
MMEVPWNLTFGVEMEMTIRYEVDEDQWPSELARAAVANCLEENGFETEKEGCDYQKYTIQSDASIAAEDSFQPLEIASPASVYSEEAQTFLGKAIDCINTFEIETNRSCGLHVHVGNKLRGIPPQTLRRFTALVAVFERPLNSLHPPSRRNSFWAKPVGCNGFFDKCETRIGRAYLCELLKRTYPGNDDEQIFNIQTLVCAGSAKRSAYNLDPLSDRMMRTIEFRGHEGTMDRDRILNWVRMVCRILNFCHDTSIADFHIWILEKGSRTLADYDAASFLDDIGLPTKVSAFFRNHLRVVEEPIEDTENFDSLEQMMLQGFGSRMRPLDPYETLDPVTAAMVLPGKELVKGRTIDHVHPVRGLKNPEIPPTSHQEEGESIMDPPFRAERPPAWDTEWAQVAEEWTIPNGSPPAPWGGAREDTPSLVDLSRIWPVSPMTLAERLRGLNDALSAPGGNRTTATDDSTPMML